jgi:hypothetical protein
MLTRILTAALMSLSLSAFEREDPEASRGSVAIIVDMETPAREVLAAMQSELTSIFHLPGLDLVWRTLDKSTPYETFERLVVMRLRGDCAGYRPPFKFQSKILGFSHASDGVILPFAEVDCDGIRALLASSGRDRIHPATFGRALGRVAAHELFHSLVGTFDHSEDGIGRAAFTPYDLTCEQLQLSDKDLLTLQRALPVRRTASASN